MTQKTTEAETSGKTLTAEELAQAALRGYFGDPNGFAKMDSASQKRAIAAVKRLIKG